MRHQIPLFDAHPVLSGQAPAHIDAEFQNIRPERLAFLKITGFVGVEQDQRMHIAVARMEHIAHGQAVLGSLNSPIRRSTSGRDETGIVPSRHI